jgi:hypothetical protein
LPAYQWDLFHTAYQKGEMVRRSSNKLFFLYIFILNQLDCLNMHRHLVLILQTARNKFGFAFIVWITISLCKKMNYPIEKATAWRNSVWLRLRFRSIFLFLGTLHDR